MVSKSFAPPYSRLNAYPSTLFLDDATMIWRPGRLVERMAGFLTVRTHSPLFATLCALAHCALHMDLLPQNLQMPADKHGTVHHLGDLAFRR